MLMKEIKDNEENIIVEAKTVFAKKGKSIVRKYRCTCGPRQGRLVKNPADCFKPKDLKKRFTLAKTKAKKGKLMTRKANKTKKYSAISKQVRRLNR